MAAKIWFGNRQKQAWIPAPNVDQEWSDVGRNALIQLEGGGVYVEESHATHKEGMFEWTDDAEALRIVREFRQGVWGPGPFFWVDPYASDVNMLNAQWATPGIIPGTDWPEIYTARAVAGAAAPAGILGLPTRTATYSPTNLSSAATPSKRFTILIPPGHKLAFGVHGSVTGSGAVALRPTLANGTTGATRTFSPLPTDGETAYNAVDLFPYSEGNRVVDIFLARSTGAPSTLTLAGMRAMLVPEARTIATTGDPFASAEGAGGLSFSGGIRETRVFIGPDRANRRKGFAVKLVEARDWA